MVYGDCNYLKNSIRLLVFLLYILYILWQVVEFSETRSESIGGL